MKKYALVILLLIFSKASSQNSDNLLKKVDQIVYFYTSVNSFEELVKKIDYDFSSDLEKTRAIYTWLALNIEYDHNNTNLVVSPKKYIVYNNEDYKRRLKIDKEKSINYAFKNKKGVCKEFAYLFQKACNMLNIKNELVYGYTRSSSFQIGLIPNNKNHIWNAVKLNNKWVLIDATFGAGYIYKDIWQQKFDTSYFNISGKKLSLTHFPSSPFWGNFMEQQPLNQFCNSPLINSGYIKQNVTIIRPINGNIKIGKSNKIKLQFKNLPKTTKVYYKYENDFYLKETRRSSKNSIVSITLPKPKKNDNLKVYFGNELALEYNVIVNE